MTRQSTIRSSLAVAECNLLRGAGRRSPATQRAPRASDRAQYRSTRAGGTSDRPLGPRGLPLRRALPQGRRPALLPRPRTPRRRPHLPAQVASAPRAPRRESLVPASPPRHLSAAGFLPPRRADAPRAPGRRHARGAGASQTQQEAHLSRNPRRKVELDALEQLGAAGLVAAEPQVHVAEPQQRSDGTRDGPRAAPTRRSPRRSPRRLRSPPARLRRRRD